MKDLLELVIIIDKSGSMDSLVSDVIGGYNSLIKEQKEAGETKVTTIFFNDKVKVIHNNVDIKDIKQLDNRTYRPGGSTALLDAIGDAICLIKERHAKLSEDELPSKTLFSIMTDGYENSSREYSYPKIRSMIELQKECGWEFIFQAANIDVEREVDRLGIDIDDAIPFAATPTGVRDVMEKCSLKIKNSRKKPQKKA